MKLPLRAAGAISPQYVSQPIQTLGIATVRGAADIRQKAVPEDICCVGPHTDLTVCERHENYA